ncbi:MAG: hypothetical protein AB7E31_04210 [Desulfitobacterium sp.]
MASKTINTILNLKDNMSGGLVRVSKKVSGLSKEAQRATKQVSNMSNKFIKSVDKMISKGAKLAAIGLGTAALTGGGLALKTGFTEAFDLEGYRIQLETATKDTKKAGEIMKWAVDLANKTPFEAGPLVEGASKLEMMGMSATEWLPKIGDMAAATNKPVDQAVEALIDAQTGELERLKEFGITKALITKKAGEMFRNQTVVNNKGQIVDQEKFNKALVAIMEDRYKGGMDKLSDSTRGIWSTITGTTKSALSEIVGMTSDGTIRQGSMLEKVKGKAKQLADQFEKWQKDGTISRISKQFSDGFSTAYQKIKDVYNFLKKYQDFIIFFGTFALTIVTVTKVVTGLKGAFKVLQLAGMLLNGTLALSPFGWIALAIAAVVAAGVLLYKNWDTVKVKAEQMWVAVENAFKTGVNGAIGLINSLIEKINLIPGVNIPLIAEVKMSQTTAQQVEGAKQNYWSNRAKYGKNALGTNYFRGGMSLVGERGPELVSLPGGSKVATADKTRQALGGKGVNVQVIIQGNVIGNETFADYVGDRVVSKVLLAVDNM